MSKVVDLITIGSKTIIVVDTDPTLEDGIPAVAGTIAIHDSDLVGDIWLKKGTNSNDWVPLSRDIKTPEIIKITNTHLNQKYIKLKSRPYNDLRVINEEGLQQILGLDFKINADIIEWDKMGFDGQLEEGENLAFYY